MLSKDLQQLKVSLNAVIDKWVSQVSETKGWSELGYVGDYSTELITNAAFNVLLTIQDTNAYFETNHLLKED